MLFLLPLRPIGFSEIFLYLFTERNKIVLYNIFNLSLIYLIIYVPSVLYLENTGTDTVSLGLEPEGLDSYFLYFVLILLSP